LRILELESFGREELLARLRRVRLVGHGQARPYAAAGLTVETVAPDELAVAQNYLLSANVERILALRSALLEHGVDLFALDGGLRVRTDAVPGEWIPVIPPVVEESHEPDGRTVLLINDGVHRVYAARSCGEPITVVIARGVPREYPYYSYPLEGGWSRVEALPELPAGYRKKAYREPEDHKALYRDFNAVFPGVQEVRPLPPPRAR
jgi:hypothetical protein